MRLLIAAILLLLAVNSSSAQQKLDVRGLKWGEITVDGITYEKDIVIDNGTVRERSKKPSKPYKKNGTGHTPLTHYEKIPWDCDSLLIGKGQHSRLPITDEFKAEAEKRGVKLIIMSTRAAVKYFQKNQAPRMNAIFHLTC
jgi:hypothetical protein